MSNSSTTDWWTRAFAIIAIICSGYSIWINYHTSKLHLDPSVKCFFEKTDNNQLRFSIKNEGPLTASLLSVAYYGFMYYPKKKIISIMEMQSSPLSEVPGKNWLYVKNLEPNEIKSKIITDNRKQERDYIFIYLLKLRYYRKNDMKLFTKDSIFFANRNNIYSHKEFKERSDYKHIRQQMDINFHKHVDEYKNYFQTFVSD